MTPTTALSPQVQQERDELYRKFTDAIQEVQQKTGFKNLMLERKLQALTAAVEKREVQFNEVLASSNLDPAALTLVSRKLEVGPGGLPRRHPHFCSTCSFVSCGGTLHTVLCLLIGHRPLS